MANQPLTKITGRTVRALLAAFPDKEVAAGLFYRLKELAAAAPDLFDRPAEWRALVGLHETGPEPAAPHDPLVLTGVGLRIASYMRQANDSVAAKVGRIFTEDEIHMVALSEVS